MSDPKNTCMEPFQKRMRLAHREALAVQKEREVRGFAILITNIQDAIIKRSSEAHKEKNAYNIQINLTDFASLSEETILTEISKQISDKLTVDFGFTDQNEDGRVQKILTINIYHWLMDN